jgi:hypothetical protein
MTSKTYQKIKSRGTFPLRTEFVGSEADNKINNKILIFELV